MNGYRHNSRKDLKGQSGKTYGNSLENPAQSGCNILWIQPEDPAKQPGRFHNGLEESVLFLI